MISLIKSTAEVCERPLGSDSFCFVREKCWHSITPPRLVHLLDKPDVFCSISQWNKMPPCESLQMLHSLCVSHYSLVSQSLCKSVSVLITLKPCFLSSQVKCWFCWTVTWSKLFHLRNLSTGNLSSLVEHVCLLWWQGDGFSFLAMSQSLYLLESCTSQMRLVWLGWAFGCCFFCLFSWVILVGCWWWCFVSSCWEEGERVGLGLTA